MMEYEKQGLTHIMNTDVDQAGLRGVSSQGKVTEYSQPHYYS